MTPLRPLEPGDQRALSAAWWNEVVRRVNHLTAIRGEGDVRVDKSDGNIVIGAPSAASRDGLFGLDPEIKGFIHVGLNEHDSNFIGPQRIRNWNTGNYETVDLVGRWEQWYPAQGPDFVWRLRLQPTFNYRIKRIELYQVIQHPATGVPFWSSGQAWATKQYIKAFEHQPGVNKHVDPNGLFNVYPLAVYASGSPLGSGSALNNDYNDFLSQDVFAGHQTTTFYFAGHSEQFASLGEYFRVMLFLENTATGNEYRVVRGTISTAATNPSTEL